MIDADSRQITIVDENGSHEFDPEELESRLARSFLAAGLHELSIAGDIVLAVDYALCRSDRARRRFTSGELNAAVARILDDTGYPEVARLFRRENSTSSVSLRATPETLRPLVERYTGAAPGRARELADIVAADAAKLGITQGPPSLFVELARYRDRACDTPKPIACASCAPVQAGEDMFLISGEALFSQLTGQPAQWVRKDILRLLPVSRLFPCIRIFFRMEACAAAGKLDAPVTELALLPVLYEAGAVIGETVEQMRRACAGEPDVPVPPFYLELPELRYFAEHSMGVAEAGAEALCRTLADTLQGSIPCEVCRLRWN